MEIKEGKLLVKLKGGKHWKKRHVKIDNKDISIPKEFILDNSMNNKNCTVYFENNEIIDIEINGKKIFKEEKKKKVKKIPKCENKKNLKIPNDTCFILQNSKINIDNFNLKLNKFIIFNDNGEAKIKEQKINETFLNRNWNFYESNIKKYYNIIKNLDLNFSIPIKLKTTYRLLIGSEQSVYETSIRLHHIYGIPYIPSTAIKGVVRSYYIQKKFANELENYDDYSKFEKEKLYKDDNFLYYFGSQEQEGKIIFFDAFPTTPPKIKVDIMNPHYGDYYNDNKNKIAPTDDKNPIPIPFLTVEDTEFKFFIASKEPINEDFIKLFEKALQNHGIGAKTSVGYGYLE